MNTELASLWNKVLGEIKTEVSLANYGSLFKQTHLVSLEDNIATIGVPSVMIINLLQSRFLPQIKKLLSTHTGKELTVIFIPKAMPVTERRAIKETPLFDQSSQAYQEKTPSSIIHGELRRGEAHPRSFGATEGPAYAKGFVEAKQGIINVQVGHLPRVRADFTFANFAVSSTNQLAFVSATNVARNIGRSYNPFFIYGPVGVGKTHLMHAIANEVYRREPDRKIIYIKSEEFTNEVVEAIRNNETAKMKRRFRSAYLLLIDDIQFIAGKDKVQEELFHTFNILIDNGSQIALSSDRPPQEIKKLERRLSSRFAGGLSIDIEAPGFELKTAIVMIKAKKYGYDLQIDAAKALAEGAEDTRALEGLLIRVITQAESTNSAISIEFVKQVLGGVVEEKSGHIHAEDIIKSVCIYYNVKSTQLKGPKRDAGLVRARQVAMYLLKERLSLTQAEIGNLLGGRDHTTIMYGVDKIRVLVENKDIVNEDIKGIINHFQG